MAFMPRIIKAGTAAVPVLKTVASRGAASAWMQRRSFHRSEGGISDELLFYSLRQPSPVTLREMFDFGKNPTEKTLLLAAQFLQEELPIRIAQRARELRRLPYGLSDTPSVQNVAQLYEDSFKRMMAFPPVRTTEQEREYTKLLSDIKQRHANVQSMVAEGIQQLSRKLKGIHHGDTVALDLSSFLDRFYMSRISIRMLIGQHVALHEPQPPNYVGIIQSDCDPGFVAEQAADDARHNCEYYFCSAPEVEVVGNTDVRLQYVPTHLYYICFELIKNSTRAVVEYHGAENDLPKITIVIAEGEEDIAIKISDRGGGIPRSGMSRIWTYTFSTASNPLADSNMNSGMMASPMAGYGHGLPLSRLYAKYFGGDIKVISMEGYGTDAYIYVRKVGDVDEQLP
mmetsp:Transcript_1548/g.3127  ORF Transcript_1548/g.3127 Transcript_1548/m.3127 type:complete len:398 (-) Transcript_1548:231-1424(-)